MLFFPEKVQEKTNSIANGEVKRNTDDYDNDLNPLLEKASNEQLQPLVEIGSV